MYKVTMHGKEAVQENCTDIFTHIQIWEGPQTAFEKTKEPKFEKELI